MTTIYPNIIYHPDTDTTIFIDTLQEIGGSAQSELVTYQSSVDGSLNTFERETLPRTISLNGKISSDNESTLRRQLQYLRGKQVYLMLGARNLATVAKIRNFDMQVSVGTYTPLALDVVCEGSSEGQFWDGTDYFSTSNCAVESDDDSVNGISVRLYQSGSYVRNFVKQSEWTLPAGDYIFFARVVDQYNITDEITLEVRNYIDDTAIASDTYTTTMGEIFPEYAFVKLDFTIDSADDGDDVQFKVIKNTSNVNNVYLGAWGFVRTD
jgi:hypothetical protein